MTALQATGNDGEAALKETGSINRSLFTLGQVLAGLSMRKPSFRYYMCIYVYTFIYLLMYLHPFCLIIQHFSLDCVLLHMHDSREQALLGAPSCVLN